MMKNQGGNAVVIILIAVALFAALTFTLSRSVQDGESNELTRAQTEIYASQLMSYAAEVESAISQMLYSGAEIDDLDFVLPDDTDFETGSDIYKVFHPDGGGVNLKRLPEGVIAQVSATTPADWYLDRFNNVEWTPTTKMDVILTAHQIAKSTCEEINKVITGSRTIPALNDSLSNILVAGNAESDLDETACSDCEGYASLCVSNVSVNAWSFYTIVAAQ